MGRPSDAPSHTSHESQALDNSDDLDAVIIGGSGPFDPSRAVRHFAANDTLFATAV